MYNNFTDICIDNNHFFINSYSTKQNLVLETIEVKQLFHIKNGELIHFGYFDINKKKCVQEYSEITDFSHKKFFNIESTNLQKPTLLYFLNNSHIHYHTRILCEYLVNQHNFHVIVVGEKLWNIFINGVMYMRLNSKCINYIARFNIVKIFMESFKFFIFFCKSMFDENIEYNFICYKLQFAQDEIIFSKNFYFKIDKFIFFSQNELNYFKIFYTQSQINLQDYILSSYIISDIAYNLTPQNLNTNMETNYIITYDKCADESITFFKKICENIDTNQIFKLIIFTDNISEEVINGNKNILIYPRYENTFFSVLDSAHYFFTYQIQPYSHFMITMALKCNLVCFIPKYFQGLQSADKCFCFDNISDGSKQFCDFWNNKIKSSENTLEKIKLEK